MNKIESGPIVINPSFSKEERRESLFGLLKRKKPEEDTVPCLLNLKKINRLPGGIVYDGCLYEGALDAHGIPNGTGSVRGPYSSFSGRIANGLRHGKGILFAGSEVYEGDFENDVFHGQGKLTIDHIGVYEGAFVNGKFHGKGKFSWKDGTVYEGDFFEDTSHGKGVLRFT
ncbi:MAG: hypothetical protein ACK4HV_05845, partial [Parachlamydiaceae bacterium]